MRVAYSQAQRVEAVRLFWKVGSATKVVHRLRYPASTHTLMAWVDQRRKDGVVRACRFRGVLLVLAAQRKHWRAAEPVLLTCFGL